MAGYFEHHELGQGFHFMNCATCGVTHGVSSAIYNRSEKQGLPWFCPNGHIVGIRFSQDPYAYEKAVNQLRSYLKDVKDERDALREKIAALEVVRGLQKAPLLSTSGLYSGEVKKDAT